MLITEVPSKPDYLRVKLRRRVQRLGAIGLKGAVYLLPETPDTMEQFQWLRREIVADAGEATICQATLIDGMTDAEVSARFSAERDVEYHGFVDACAALEVRWRGADEAERPALVAERGRLFTRLEDILRRDFFGASQRESAMRAMEQLAVLEIVSDDAPRPGTRRDFTGRVWATRSGVKVDRIASAWLIRRKIDNAARFVFAPDAATVPAESVRFDMFDGEFTHQGSRCTFEVLLDYFDIADPALRAIGQMVHDIDLHEEMHSRPETAGFAVSIEGILLSTASDDERLREGTLFLDRFAAGLRP